MSLDSSEDHQSRRGSNASRTSIVSRMMTFTRPQLDLYYAYEVDDLYGMLDPKSPDALEELGGVEAIARGLHTSLDNGFSTQVKGSSDVGLTSEEKKSMEKKKKERDADSASQEPLKEKRIKRPYLIEQSRLQYGENKLPEPEFKSLWDLVVEAISDKTLIMLIIAACISLVVGMLTEGESTGWKDGTAVLVAVIIVVAITSFNDYQKERQFRELNDKKNDRDVNVIRDGAKQSVPISEVVVGDLVIIETGDVVPVDGLFVRGTGVQTDESAATGESKQIKKGHAPDADPFFLSGTQVVEGNGVILCVAVGSNSYNGRILMALRTPESQTPLEEKLGVLADLIGNFGLVAAIVIFVAQLIKYFIVESTSFDSDALQNMVDFLIIAISIVVVAVPEGLPLAVTISLAYSMDQMMDDNNLVRRLDACETMGGATTVCSDKTGTLTQNVMTVVQGSIGQHPFDEQHEFSESLASAGDDEKSSGDLSNKVKSLFGAAVATNSTAFEGGDGRTGKRKYIGSQTECALLRFLKKHGGDYNRIRNANEPVQQYSFSSKRKRMSTVIPNSGGPGTVFHCKGASEVVLGMCSKILLADGTETELTAAMREKLSSLINSMAENALRTLMLAYRECPDGDKRDWTDEEHPNLVCLAVVGIRDPLRPEVADAVAVCTSAGVTIRMVTGDNATTAINIAKACGILEPESNHVCMEGPSFRKLSDAQKDQVVPHLRVLARSSPLDKLELVKSLQRLGEVVAVTGDGVNDGPALKKADVGFSMGLSGTDVAKEASAIVLLDDNFASIVNAIKWGRNVFDSIRKFLQFQLTVNFAAILFVFIVILSDSEGTAESTPLQPVQLLWINLIMDTFAAVALATEPPDESLLKFQPYDRNEPLLRPFMWRKMIFQIVMQVSTFLIIFYEGKPVFDSDDKEIHLTVIFNVFVLSQLFNELNARKLRPEFNVLSKITRHKIYMFVWVFALGVQALLVQFGGTAVHVKALNLRQWLLCIAFAALSLVWGFMVNALPSDYSTSPLFWQKPVERQRSNSTERQRARDLAAAARRASFVADDPKYASSNGGDSGFTPSSTSGGKVMAVELAKQ